MWEQGYIGFAPETRYGSAVNPTSYFLPARFGRFTQVLQNDELSVHGINPPQSTRGVHLVEVSGQVDPQPDILRHILSGLLGDCRPAQRASGVAEYVFRPASARKSYTVEIAQRGLVRQAIGVHLNQVVFQLLPSNQAVMEFSGLGRSMRPKQTLATPLFFPEEGAWWNQLAFEVNGSPDTTVGNCNVTIQAPIAALDSQASAGLVAKFHPVLPTNAIIDITLLDATSAWVSYTERQLPVSFSMSLIGSTISGAHNYRVQVDIPRVIFEQSPARFSNQEIPQYTLRATGTGTPQEPRGIKVTVVVSGTAAVM